MGGAFSAAVHGSETLLWNKEVFSLSLHLGTPIFFQEFLNR